MNAPGSANVFILFVTFNSRLGERSVNKGTALALPYVYYYTHCTSKVKNFFSKI